MFSDNYIRLCNAHDVPPTALAEQLGYTRAAGARWINGSIPRQAALRRIADYFGVTVEYLLADHPENKKATADVGSGSVAEKLNQLSPEMLALFVRFLEFAESDPVRAKRFLEFATGEIQNGSESH